MLNLKQLQWILGTSTSTSLIFKGKRQPVICSNSICIDKTVQLKIRMALSKLVMQCAYARYFPTFISPIGDLEVSISSHNLDQNTFSTNTNPHTNNRKCSVYST